MTGLNDTQQKALLAIIEYGVLDTRDGEVVLYFDGSGAVRKAERRETLKRKRGD